MSARSLVAVLASSLAWLPPPALVLARVAPDSSPHVCSSAMRGPLSMSVAVNHSFIEPTAAVESARQSWPLTSLARSPQMTRPSMAMPPCRTGLTQIRSIGTCA